MPPAPAQHSPHRQKIRATAILLGLVALGFYLGFIAVVFWSGR
jgi:hypothetical protein